GGHRRHPAAPGPGQHRPAAQRARALADLHAGGHRRHPREVGARPLPDARLLDVQEDPALGRADVHARHAHALRDRGLPREVRDEDRARRALREEPADARHPDLHHGHELRRALDRGEDGARQGRLDGRDGDLLGRGRHDPARARALDQVVLPGHPEPVRVQPAPPDAGRRGRVLHRPGLQGRARRAPDGPEGHGAGGRDALAARRHRPALARPAPGLARPGRPVAEDPGDPRGDRLPDPDPAEARRRARLRRRADGGQVRPRHHLPGRRRGLDGRRAAHGDRGDRHPADGGHPRGAARPRGRRPGRRDRPRGGGRHPERRRHRQVHRARGQGRGHRPLGADRAELQQGDPGRHRLRGDDRGQGRALLPLPHGPLPGRRDDAGSGAAGPPGGRRRRRAGLQLPARDDARAPDAGPGLRQDGRAQPRARGPLRTDRRGLGDGQGAARGHDLHPGRDRAAHARRDQGPRAGPRAPAARRVRPRVRATGGRL
ncbi:MAG: Glutamate synthase [NADPH] large chain, partial [uncultured Thermoleophilia bacterium]